MTESISSGLEALRKAIKEGREAAQEMPLTSLQKLVERTEQLMVDDQAYWRHRYQEQPVQISEVLDLILTLAKEIEDVQAKCVSEDDR